MTGEHRMSSPPDAPIGAPPDTTATSAGSSTRRTLLALVNASWTTQAIAAAVQLELPALLAQRSLTAEALAEATRSHPPSLSRLLRALTTLGLLAEDADGAFALTEMGALLRADVDGSLAAWASFCGSSAWTSWGRLADCNRSGRSARAMMLGVEGLDHLATDESAARNFHRAMIDLTQPIATAFAAVEPFEGVHTVVDVGGGAGRLLATILIARPALRGVLFDQPHTREVAIPLLAGTGVLERCTLVTGSFFESIPGGADLYLLKSILHDWDDARCATILRNCRLAMPSHARLALIERVVPDRTTASDHDRAIARSDLNMLVGPGGRERTEAEYRALLETAGFAFAGTRTLIDDFSVLDAVPASAPRFSS
jgi:hypothetical protein